MAKQTNQLEQGPHKGPEGNTEITSQNLVQEAFTLYQCKDGSLAKNPRECTGTVDNLPALPNFTIG
jgi:hypothetical protein